MADIPLETTTFEALGFDCNLLGLSLEGNLEPIGNGFNSRAFLAPDLGLVIKLCDGKDTESARALHNAMRDEHDLAEEFYAEHIPRTGFVMVRNEITGLDHVVAVQDYKKGMPVAEFLEHADADTSALESLLIKGLLAYSATRKISDMACIEHGFFNPMKSPNTIIDDGGFAWLVDTTFGKIQRSRQLGLIWNTAIANGVSRAVKKIR